MWVERPVLCFLVTMFSTLEPFPSFLFYRCSSLFLSSPAPLESRLRGVRILDPPRIAGLVQIPCRSGVARSFLFYSVKPALFSVSLHLCTHSPAGALGKERASSVLRGSPQSSSDTWHPFSALQGEVLQPPPGGRFALKPKVAIRSSLRPVSPASWRQPAEKQREPWEESCILRLVQLSRHCLHGKSFL